ncbi:MAG: hypothetical protein ACYDG2_03935 [Ruminiclostridium sp.]
MDVGVFTCGACSLLARIALSEAKEQKGFHKNITVQPQVMISVQKSKPPFTNFCCFFRSTSAFEK